MLIGQDRGFWIFPRVYCVAYNQTYQTIFYQETRNSTFYSLQPTHQLHQSLFNRNEMYFYRATGSCKGISC